MKTLFFAISFLALGVSLVMADILPTKWQYWAVLAAATAIAITARC